MTGPRRTLDASAARASAAIPATALRPASRGPARGRAALSALLVLLAVAALLAAGCAPPPRRHLEASIAVGAFSGPGGDRLAAELSARSRRSPDPALVLSGTTSFDSSLVPGRERVLAEPPRQAAAAPAPAGPGGPSGGWEERTIPFQSFTATLKADWTLSDPATGAVARAGTTSDTLRRSAGGWLAEQGAAPEAAPADPEALRLLSAALADQIIEELGPALDASALGRADDDRSRRALRLAEAGDWGAAAELWEELVALNPEYAPALYNLGLHHERLGELEEAWSFYRRAYLAQSVPLHREALTRLTDSLDRLGRPPRGGSNPLAD
jgi:hypothetical protein